ncbi:MAG: division/cell wall cluster transcriptional repressor MraZ [Verrucomicrobiota bacterium]
MNATVGEVYTDTFEHSFDEKGRVVVPSEWRSEAHEKRLHVMPSQEGCLKVYPASFLNEQKNRLAGASFQDPRRKQLENLARIIQSAECDQQGRIMVKSELRKGATLSKETILVGCLDHFEIWDRKLWKGKAGVATSFEDVMGQLGA